MSTDLQRRKGKLGPEPKPIEERFWPKVDRRAPDDCWPWLASKCPLGYGRFSRGGRGRSAKAHRVAYELVVGPIPDGLELDHLCRNPSCVNPAHLEPVTHAENMRRGKKATATHCPHGHPYDAENTYYWPSGNGRKCRTCHRHRERGRKRDRSKKVAA